MTSNTNNNGHEGLSPFVCACFTFNYLLGTGFLTLPWAFQQAGVFLSSVVMILCCVVANISSDYILTAMARAEAIVSYRPPSHLQHQDEETLNNDIILDPPKEVGVEDEKTLLLEKKNLFFVANDKDKTPVKKYVTAFSMEYSSPTSNEYPGNHCDNDQHQQEKKEHLLLIKDRKFDFTELCHIFLGNVGQKIYSAYVCLDIYTFLWVYASVFANAMTTIFQQQQQQQQEGQDLYPWFVLLFAIIVVPMSLMELSEQTYIQVFLSGCRILMVLLLVMTPLVAAAANADHHHPIPHFDNQSAPNGITTLFDLSHMHQMVPIVVYSVIFHQAVPGLAHETKQKSKIGTIFAYTFLLCGLTYTMIGWIDAWYFGNAIYESCNLNWQVYHGGTGRFVQSLEDYEAHAELNHNNGKAEEKEELVDAAPWAQFISSFVVIFPAVDVVSAFPIYAYILGNSMRDMMTTNQAGRKNYGDIDTNTNDNYDSDVTTNHGDMNYRSNRCINMSYRALAAIPPILGAFFVRELGVVTDYSGLTGLAIAFCFPPMLFIASDHKIKKLELQQQKRYQKTVYERFGSSIIAAKMMFLFGLISIIYCFCLLTFNA